MILLASVIDTILNERSVCVNRGVYLFTHRERFYGIIPNINRNGEKRDDREAIRNERSAGISFQAHP